jgi:double-stranded uracil-DNA glycosylase
MTKLRKAPPAPTHAQIRTATDVLPDVLRASLRVVLCGTAVGTASARAGAYYAHKQNKFWKILHGTGLTPTLLSPHQYRELLQHGIGLTDFVKTHSGMDHQIPLTELTEGLRTRLRAAMMKFRPSSSPSPARPAGNGFWAAGAPRAFPVPMEPERSSRFLF